MCSCVANVLFLARQLRNHRNVRYMGIYSGMTQAREFGRGTILHLRDAFILL